MTRVGRFRAFDFPNGEFHPLNDFLVAQRKRVSDTLRKKSATWVTRSQRAQEQATGE